MDCVRKCIRLKVKKRNIKKALSLRFDKKVSKTFSQNLNHGTKKAKLVKSELLISKSRTKQHINFIQFICHTFESVSLA